MDTFKTQLAGILEILVRAAVCEVSSLMERRAGDSVMAFQDKLASLSEILARAAVREITQLTDERFVESCRGFSRAKSRGAPPEPSLQRPDNGAACAGQTPCVQTRCVGVQVSLGITGAQSQATTKGAVQIGALHNCVEGSVTARQRSDNGCGPRLRQDVHPTATAGEEELTEQHDTIETVKDLCELEPIHMEEPSNEHVMQRLNPTTSDHCSKKLTNLHVGNPAESLPVVTAVGSNTDLIELDAGNPTAQDASLQLIYAEEQHSDLPPACTKLDVCNERKGATESARINMGDAVLESNHGKEKNDVHPTTSKDSREERDQFRLEPYERDFRVWEQEPGQKITLSDPVKSLRSCSVRVERLVLEQRCISSVCSPPIVSERPSDITNSKNTVHCTQCGKNFNSNQGLKIHQRLHTGEKPYSCVQCGKAFSWYTSFKNHQQCHNVVKQYSCAHCGDTFQNTRSLNLHQKTHTRTSVSQCGKGLSDSGSLDIHLKIPMEKKTHCCSWCGKIFSTSEKLHRHLQIHTVCKMYNCTQCGKVFTSLFWFKLHQKIHEGMKLQSCRQCGKSFITAEKLKTHQHLHLGEKPGCCTQPKRFAQSGSLKRCQTRETGGKRYGCSHCGKDFSRQDTLTLHHKKHTGQKLPGCTVCDKSFVKLGSLKSHLSVHSKEKRDSP